MPFQRWISASTSGNAFCAKVPRMDSKLPTDREARSTWVTSSSAALSASLSAAGAAATSCAGTTCVTRSANG